MAMCQAVWIPQSLWLGLEQPFTWVVTLVLGIALGAAVGGIQGFVVAYGGVPSFIVTLGGLLIWRGLIFRYAQGQTIAPLDTTFQMLGGGTVGTRVGALGEWPSWILGVVICLVIAYTLIASRRGRGARGHQRAPNDHAHFRAHGEPRGDQRRGPDRSPRRRRDESRRPERAGRHLRRRHRGYVLCRRHRDGPRRDPRRRRHAVVTLGNGAFARRLTDPGHRRGDRPRRGRRPRHGRAPEGELIRR